MAVFVRGDFVFSSQRLRALLHCRHVPWIHFGLDTTTLSWIWLPTELLDFLEWFSQQTLEISPAMTSHHGDPPLAIRQAATGVKLGWVNWRPHGVTGALDAEITLPRFIRVVSIIWFVYYGEHWLWTFGWPILSWTSSDSQHDLSNIINLAHYGRSW